MKQIEKKKTSQTQNEFNQFILKKKCMKAMNNHNFIYNKVHPSETVKD